MAKNKFPVLEAEQTCSSSCAKLKNAGAISQGAGKP